MPGDRAVTHIRSDDLFLSWLAVVFGAVIIVCHLESGASRWQAAAWQYAVRVPGSPATWGVVILAAGVAMVYGNRTGRTRLAKYGYCTASWWFCILSSAAALAMLDDIASGSREANPLSLVVWPAFAYFYWSRVRGNRLRR